MRADKGRALGAPAQCLGGGCAGEEVAVPTAGDRDGRGTRPVGFSLCIG